MSLQNKITRVVEKAVQDAAETERARCLWVLSKIEDEIESELRKMLLVEAQRHTIGVKKQIFGALCAQVRRGIISGMRPAEKTNGEDRDDGAALPAQRG